MISGVIVFICLKILSIEKIQSKTSSPAPITCSIIFLFVKFLIWRIYYHRKKHFMNNHRITLLEDRENQTLCLCSLTSHNCINYFIYSQLPVSRTLCLKVSWHQRNKWITFLFFCTFQLLLSQTIGVLESMKIYFEISIHVVCSTIFDQ